MSSLLEKLDRVPPYAYRLMASDGRIPLSPDTIAERSGLSRATIHRISQLKSWATVKMAVAEAYARGCGFSLNNQKIILRRLRYMAKHERGILSLRHFQDSGPFWRRGARANTLRFVATKMIQ